MFRLVFGGTKSNTLLAPITSRIVSDIDIWQCTLSHTYIQIDRGISLRDETQNRNRFERSKFKLTQADLISACSLLMTQPALWMQRPPGYASSISNIFRQGSVPRIAANLRMECRIIDGTNVWSGYESQCSVKAMSTLESNFSISSLRVECYLEKGKVN